MKQKKYTYIFFRHNHDNADIQRKPSKLRWIYYLSNVVHVYTTELLVNEILCNVHLSLDWLSQAWLHHCNLIIAGSGVMAKLFVIDIYSTIIWKMYFCDAFPEEVSMVVVVVVVGSCWASDEALWSWMSHVSDLNLFTPPV